MTLKLVDYPRKEIFDIKIGAIPLSGLATVVSSYISQGEKETLFYINAHTLNVANVDGEYKEILKRASLVYAGGLGPVIASWILNQTLPGRSPTPDFINKVFEIAEKKGWSVYLLGTTQKSLIKVVAKIKKNFSKLSICGFHHGFFAPEEEEDIIAEINSKNPTVVIVGMGTPKQEKWIAKNKDKINAKAFWAVGALFDVISGELPRAPKWVQVIGLEWFFRFCQEPRRLWKRYVIGNLLFILAIFLALISQLNWAGSLKRYFSRPLYKLSWIIN